MKEFTQYYHMVSNQANLSEEMEYNNMLVASHPTAVCHLHRNTEALFPGSSLPRPYACRKRVEEEREEPGVILMLYSAWPVTFSLAA